MHWHEKLSSRIKEKTIKTKKNKISVRRTFRSCSNKIRMWKRTNGWRWEKCYKAKWQGKVTTGSFQISNFKHLSQEYNIPGKKQQKKNNKKYLSIFVSLYIYIYIYKETEICIYMCVCVCVCVHTYIYVYMCICVCVCTYIYICIYVYMYIHIYMYVYIHIYIYIYSILCIHISLFLSLSLSIDR